VRRESEEGLTMGEEGEGRTELTDGERAEYFRRCYTAADGLWFMKVEEMRGFEEALEADRRVWSILPKIQARTLRTMLKADEGIEGLARCISAKHSAEGFDFEAKMDEDGRLLRLIISKCPWHELLVRSGREALSERVGTTICNAEYAAWAEEFGGGAGRISFSLRSQICKGDQVCTFCFEESRSPEGPEDPHPHQPKTGRSGSPRGGRLSDPTGSEGAKGPLRSSARITGAEGERAMGRGGGLKGEGPRAGEGTSQAEGDMRSVHHIGGREAPKIAPLRL
jgi:hypothetical protein